MLSVVGTIMRMRPSSRSPARFRPTEGLVEVSYEVAGADLELLASLCQIDLARGALEQPGSDRVLELADPLGGHGGH